MKKEEIPIKYKQEGFESAEKRKRWIQNRTKRVRQYLKRKGVEDREEAIEHCIGFIEFLGGARKEREDFRWSDYHLITKDFDNVFAYYTKEKYGWEDATVPKENYNYLFE